MSGIPAGNFLRAIYLQAAASPGRVALLTTGHGIFTYERLCAEALEVGGRLAGAGLNRGHVVAALAEGADLLRICLGACGVSTFAPVNPTWPQGELEALLSRLRPSAIVCSDSYPAATAAARALGVPILEKEDLLSSTSECACAANSPQGIIGSDPGFLLHTSATTGTAKLVCLTHANFVAMAMNSVRALGLTAADRLLSLMPLFHLQGIQSALQQLMVGGSVVCAGSAAGQVPGWIREFRPTWYTAGPALHRAILSVLREPGRASDIGGLRLVRSIGAPLAPELLAELEEVLRVPVLEGYRLTETGAVTSNPLPPGPRKPGSVGISIGPEVGILDEQGKVSIGTGRGEIVVRGPSVFSGYRGDPRATEAAFHAGWFRTGDLGSFDSDGYLYVTGRIKEMINRGGEKILPGEIDEVLAGHPGVKEAAALGVPHPTLGEDIAVAVVPHAGADLSTPELRRYAAARLAAFKVPRRFMIVDAIPRSATGKPQRHALAERARNSIAARSTPSFSGELQIRVADCWADILKVRDFGPEDDFFSLGDSLGAKLMLTQLEEEFGAIIDEAEFLADPTIATLTRLIEAGEKDCGPDTGKRTGLITIQPHGKKAPLFLIPDASLDAFYLRHLAACFAPERPFHVLRDIEADGADRSVEATAARFAGLLRAVHANGRYVIGGHCYGGIVAFELARQLAAGGTQASLLVLFDTPTPGYPKVLRNWRRYCRHLLGVTRKDAVEHLRFLGRLVRQRFEMRMSRARRPAPTEEFEPTPSNIAAARAYLPRMYQGKVHAILAAGEHPSTRVLEDSRLGWRDFAAGGIEFSTTPGTHHTMFQKPHVEALGDRLSRLLETAEV